MDMPVTSDCTAPDFRHIDTWIFDLDNTLYPAGGDIFAQVDARMTLFIMRLLSLPAHKAKALQHAYYRGYGTTLSGLMAIQHIDPDEFLAYVHDIDLCGLTPDPRLQQALERLPGRRFVFTNGSYEHAERILRRLNLSDSIEDIWDIRKSHYTPKPAAKAYKRLIEKEHIDPQSSAFFEDLARNLVPAHALGMTTVWLNTGASWGGVDPGFSSAARTHITHETGDLAGFLLSIGI
jgi:putative hydrolase of the HAD superfamily